MSNMPNVEIPLFYAADNFIQSAYNPSYYHVKNTTINRYFKRILYNKLMSIFEFEVPENWDRDFIKNVLFINGFMGVFDTAEYGVVPQFGTISGYDLYYRPKRFLCNNPYMDRQYYDLEIGRDCMLVKLTDDYRGILDIINYYADLLSLGAETLGVNLFTARVGYVGIAGNKAAAEALKKGYDQLSGGDPFIVLDKELLREDGHIPWEWFSQNLKQNYITSDLLMDMRRIETMFDAEIGLNNANVEKRERLLVDEVNANNESTISKSEVWLQNLKEGFAEVYKKFGVRVTVKRRFENETVSAAVDNDSVPS